MRFFTLLLLALPLTVPAQTPEPSLRTTTSEVLLDFVVRDKSSRMVRDLRPEEIQVLEDGVPQTVRQFEFVHEDSSTGRVPQKTPAHRGSPSQPQSSAAASTVNELRDISVVSLVIANLDPRGRQLALDTMRNFIKDELRPHTYIGVFGLGSGVLRSIQPYTNDAEKISAAMDRVSRAAMLGQLTSNNQLSMPDTDFGSALNGGIGTASDPNGPGGPSGPATVDAGGQAALIAQVMDTHWITEMNDVYADSRNYLAPLHEFVQSQASIPGRKVLLLFSAGLPVQSDTVEPLRTVISAANRANVSIYAVDTAGFTAQSNLEDSRRILKATTEASMQQQLAKLNGTDGIITPTEVLSMEMGEDSIHANTMGNMAELADGTGGKLLPASLDLRDPLHHVMEEVGTHYELSYSPSNRQLDGGFRKVEVKVRRPGTKVFARGGYYAVPVLNGHEIYPFELATLRALNTKPDMHQFSFHAATLQFRSGPDQTQLAFVFQSPIRDLSMSKDGDVVRVHICVTALVKNEQGQIVEKISKDIPYKMPATMKAELQRGIVSFTIPFHLAPGHYTLETAAVDRLSMRASVSRSALDVAEQSGLSMSDVAVARRVDASQGNTNLSNPLQARDGLITPELSDSVSPDDRGDLKFYAVAYPPAPIDAPVDVNIEIWRDSHLLMKTAESEVPPDGNGAASILANVKTQQLPSGHYQARVSFDYKGQKVVKSVAFTLQAGS